MRRNALPFLLGFLASSFQIILLREFSAYSYGNELTLGIVLASWLLWGGIGSLSVSKRRSPARLAGLYEAAIVLMPVALVGLRLARFVFRLLPGEQVGLAGSIIVAVLAASLVSFPLGMLFVDNVLSSGGRIARVYVLESLGAAAAGLAVEIVVLPCFSNWQAVAAVGAFSLVLLYDPGGRPALRVRSLGVVLVLTGLVIFDAPSQRLYWKPFAFVTSRDTPHGKLQVIRTGDQVSFYSNGARIFSRPDPEAAEQAVHLAVLQNPGAKRALLIGGGVGGDLAELLKYPGLDIDYVELDPELIGLARSILGEEVRGVLRDTRVHLSFADGRAYVRRSRDRYDVIILDLPGPSTAQINRFYTREFFEMAGRHLTDGGLLSFGLASSENYIGPELQDLLRSLYGTLRSVFPEVRVVPGDTNIFLASRTPLTVDPEALAGRIESLGFKTLYINRAGLAARLHPLRVDYLEKRLAGGPGRLNSDLMPITFFYESLFWSSQFRGFESSRFLRLFSGLPPVALLAVPFVLLAPWLLVFRVRRSRPGYLLAPLVTMGLTTITVEIILLVWYQSLYGYLYGRIALLLACFMLGLFAGGLAGSRVGSASIGRLALDELGLTAALGAFLLLLPFRPPQFVPFLLLFLFGAAAGDVFVVSNRLYTSERRSYGLGYGLELGGSFLGALVTSAFLIPLVGLRPLLASVALLNLLVLAFLTLRPRSL